MRQAGRQAAIKALTVRLHWYAGRCRRSSAPSPPAPSERCLAPGTRHEPTPSPGDKVFQKLPRVHQGKKRGKCLKIRFESTLQQTELGLANGCGWKTAILSAGWFFYTPADLAKQSERIGFRAALAGIGWFHFAFRAGPEYHTQLMGSRFIEGFVLLFPREPAVTQIDVSRTRIWLAGILGFQ